MIVSRMAHKLALSVVSLLYQALVLGETSWADYPPTRKVRLSNGRCLEYAEYGNPSHPLVLYFHGTPGTHLEVHAAEDALLASGVHVIAINRPGIGKSSYQCGRRILDWPGDVAEFLTLIGRDEETFGVIGFSGGTPYALACAYTMPERITRVAIVSGHTHLGICGVAQGEADRDIELFIHRPKLAKAGVKLTRRRLVKKPNKTINKVTESWDPSDRRLVRCDPEIRHILEASMKYATCQGPQGVATDARLLGCKWGFNLTVISGMPISIWHGRCDRIAPISMGRYFHSQLAGSNLHVDPSTGHISTFKRNASAIISEFSPRQAEPTPAIVAEN